MSEENEKQEKYNLANTFQNPLLDKLPVGYRLLRNPDVAKSWSYMAKSTFHNTPMCSMESFYKPVSKIYLEDTVVEE